MPNNGMENVLTKIRFESLEDIPEHLRDFFEPVYSDHFAVFPQLLCEIPIKASCPENGVVLDPFMGSGTTGVICVKLNRGFIGVDINSDYCQIAKKRIEYLLAQGSLYSCIIK